MHTLSELIQTGLDDATAIASPGARPLSYAALRQLVLRTGAALNAAGIGRNERVAIVLPNGPEMATSFIAVACATTCAPLNPAYRAEEFEFYLSDLRAKALIVEYGSQSAAIAVAEKLGVAIITLRPDADQGAGAFTLDTGTMSGVAAVPGAALADDIALVLHTSGTTSRPKIVPLTQVNVTNSAGNIAQTTRFSASDKGLNIMPLFHIHGLIAGVLAPLSRGGSVSCTPGFNALKFFAWVDEVKPTWYTAVPTMHQTILSRAGQNADIIARNRLRFIRSSSASLPTRVLAELESAFGAPVIEAYGMTEAAHQMACNPLPPAERKPGSVGLAAGPEVAIMGSEGALLAAGMVGEIVVRGANITLGYENNPQANAEAFSHGWFRTGDQGVMDAHGYVSLTGRLKEIINRGGEKISPREIDEVLMAHPAVAQVVTFAIPDARLGEEVGAVVVLREGMAATEREIRDFASEKLASYKVPKKVLFMDDIPKGATGKLQRIGLAQKLGLCEAKASS